MSKENLLKERIEQLVDKLQLNLSKDDREKLIENVTHNLLDATKGLGERELENKLRDPKFLKTMMVAIMAQRVADLHPEDPKFKFDYKKLFDPENKEFSKDELKLFFKTMLLELNKSEQQQLKFDEKDIDKFADEMAEVVCKEAKDQALENNNTIDSLCEVFIEGLKNLYGGIDPRFAGGIASPVLSITGNFAAIADQSGSGNQVSNAFIDTLNTYNPGKEDYLGIENENKNRIESFVDDFCKENSIAQAPTFRPPGTVS